MALVIVGCAKARGKKRDESWKEMEIGMNEENETVHDIHGPKSS